MRILGLDIGDKTVGVAVSDALGITAQGITTIERVGIRKDTGKVIDFIREYDCEAVVCGLPISMDGHESEQTEKVRKFARMLENKMRSTGLSKVRLEFYDERLTTMMAQRVLIEADMRRDKRKEIIDRQAAVIILQSYLDSRA